VFAHFTRFGAHVDALGGNGTSAAAILVCGSSDLLAGLAGMVFPLYTSPGRPPIAAGAVSDTVATVLIGGTLSASGSAYVFGTLIASLIQRLIQPYFALDGTISSSWTKTAVAFRLPSFVLLQRGLLSARKRRAAWAGARW
jgi:ribose/xylose/arabinose/galactoside ABC-type transport system permease subunit